jgi:hypothetical protein
MAWLESLNFVNFKDIVEVVATLDHPTTRCSSLGEKAVVFNASPPHDVAYMAGSYSPPWFQTSGVLPYY